MNRGLLVEHFPRPAAHLDPVLLWDRAVELLAKPLLLVSLVLAAPCAREEEAGSRGLLGLLLALAGVLVLVAILLMLKGYRHLRTKSKSASEGYGDKTHSRWTKGTQGAWYTSDES